MNHDAMGDAMLWVGALFVFTPIVLAGIVIGAVWFQRRGHRHGASDVPAPGPPTD